jgi:hypothetical protein
MKEIPTTPHPFPMESDAVTIINHFEVMCGVAKPVF